MFKWRVIAGVIIEAHCQTTAFDPVFSVTDPMRKGDCLFSKRCAVAVILPAGATDDCSDDGKWGMASGFRGPNARRVVRHLDR